MLERLASACFRHRWRVVALWAVGLAGLFALSGSLGGAFSDSGRLEGTDSQRAYDLLGDEMPERSGESATVVFHDPAGLDRPEARAAIGAYLDDVRTLPRVASVSSPVDSAGQIAADRSVAFAAVDFTPDGEVPLETAAAAMAEKAAALEQAGVEVAVRWLPVPGGRDPGQRGRRAPRRSRDPARRLRLRGGHGPADRHRAGRGGGLHRRAGPVGGRGADAGLHDAGGNDDRPRRGHRLRALHRDPLPGRAARGASTPTPPPSRP